MDPMSLNEWIESAGDKREHCFQFGYRDLYLDIGFFNVQFGACELNLTALLQTATQSGDPKAFDILTSGMDARVKVSRLRQAVKLHGEIGANLHARLKVFEDQCIKLRNKLAHGLLLPTEDPAFYELVSVLKQPSAVTNRMPGVEKPERVHADRIWKYGVWMNQFCMDLAQVPTVFLFNSEFEIRTPRTPVLQADRL